MNGTRDTWLLGDAGYPLQPWLLTPIQDAEPNTPEAVYNEHHCRTRNIAERGFAVWKNRFRCLKKDRVLHYSHAKAGQIIYSCAILHNICRKYNIADPDPVEENNLMGNFVNNDDRQDFVHGKIIVFEIFVTGKLRVLCILFFFMSMKILISDANILAAGRRIRRQVVADLARN